MTLIIPWSWDDETHIKLRPSDLPEASRPPAAPLRSLPRVQGPDGGMALHERRVPLVPLSDAWPVLRMEAS